MPRTSCAPLGATTRELVFAVQRNGPDANDCPDTLLEANAALIRSVVTRVHGTNSDFDAYLQDGRIAFVGAVKAYDPSRGSLASFVNIVVAREVAKSVRATRLSRLRSISVDWGNVANEAGPKDAVDDAFRFEEVGAIRSAVRGLSQREKVVIFRLYWQAEAQDSVARGLRISQQAISKRHRIALQHLKFSLSA